MNFRRPDLPRASGAAPAYPLQACRRILGENPRSRASVAAESAYTVIVANRIDVKGATLVVNADYGGTDVPVPEGMGPHSSMVTLDR